MNKLLYVYVYYPDQYTDTLDTFITGKRKKTFNGQYMLIGRFSKKTYDKNIEYWKRIYKNLKVKTVETQLEESFCKEDIVTLKNPIENGYKDNIKRAVNSLEKKWRKYGYY